MAQRTNGAQGKHWMPETMSGGGAFLDYDNDGALDLIILNNPAQAQRNATPQLWLYRNKGDGTFEDASEQTGIRQAFAQTKGDPMGAAVGDYDNDGYDDLFIASLYRSALLRNVGGKRFENVTMSSGVNDTGWATSSAWLDYDRDGKLDLFVCHYVVWSPEKNIVCGGTVPSYCRPQEYTGEACRLYRNEGGGKFREVSKEAGVANLVSKGLGVCIVDADDNGLPDIIVANDTEPNFLLLNQGNGKFREAGQESGIGYDDNGKARAGMGLDTADVRRNGVASLAIGNFTYEGVAYYELSAPPYQERSRQSGIYAPSYPYITFGLLFADFDNDGLPDLFATNGHIEDNIEKTNPGQTYAQANLLMRNLGDGKFAEATQSAGEGVAKPMVGRGACRGDFNNDGKLDLLLIPNVGAPRLLRNETPSANRWLTIRLVGTKGARNAYGAKVTVESGGRKQVGWHRSGSSYLSANDTRLHFGLGAATIAERITVRWANGQEETWRNQPADQQATLVEGQAK